MSAAAVISRVIWFLNVRNLLFYLANAFLAPFSENSLNVEVKSSFRAGHIWYWA
jgi:hypothetical protein